MYFVSIDLDQLHTRLCNCTNRRLSTTGDWLESQGFRPCDNGWVGTADAMNSLSCSEILYSERVEDTVAA